MLCRGLMGCALLVVVQLLCLARGFLVRVSLDERKRMELEMIIPPVIRITFPERSGMSLSGLKDFILIILL